MKMSFFLIFYLTFLTACQNNERSEFEITGFVEGVSDSSEVILSINNEIVQTSLIQDQKFKLTGIIDVPVIADLRIKNSKDMSSFWLENKKIQFISQSGNFSNRRIVGSKTEDNAEHLKKKMNNLRNKSGEVIKLFQDNSYNSHQKDSLLQVYRAMRNHEEREQQKFIKLHPNSMFSSYLLNQKKINWGKETSQELFSTLSKENKNSDNGKSIARFIELNRKIAVGDRIVDFEQTNIEGKKIKLSNLKAEVLLIEFWASWCAPCREANPELRRDYEKYRDDGFDIIGVSLDHVKENWKKAVEQDSLPWENVSDLKGKDNEAALIYGVNGIPDNFLVDASGKIIGRNLRGSQLSNAIETYFTKKGN